MSEPFREAPDEVVSFGPFRLFVGRRQLLEGDTPVRLGSRACGILVALLERPGQVLSKQELVAQVWPDTFVEEASLRVHVAALRRALGDGQAGRRFVTNISGRGYGFVAPVTRERDAAMTPAARAEPQQDRAAEARNLLAPIYARFAEGFGTADLKEAREVLASLPG